jgi:hypothetical protein
MADLATSYDLFVSHAFEDKDSFVRPLAEALRNQGLSVWYDEFVLELGDSLRRSIDRGLQSSRFGLVVLSPAFFGKAWPQHELDGLVNRELQLGKKLILPIWHGVDAATVAGYSPTLADRMATSTKLGLPSVVEKIVKVVRPRRAAEVEGALANVSLRALEVLRTLVAIFGERSFSRSDVNFRIDASDRFWSIVDDLIREGVVDTSYSEEHEACRFAVANSARRAVLEDDVRIPDSLMGLLDDCLETSDDVKRWWVTPHPSLEGKAPRDAPEVEVSAFLEKLYYQLDSERGNPRHLNPRKKLRLGIDPP